LAIARLSGPAPDLRHSVIAFTGLIDSVLSQADSRAVWRAFQVPVYEQLRAPDGRLLASECEAHVGLHIADDSVCVEFRPLHQGPQMLVSYLDGAARPVLRIATDLTGELDAAPCACGGISPRLVHLRKQVPKHLDKPLAVGAA
jgi:phenylacetate-coenzyme A ligase PaaK-like adenylate-forming protein